MVVTEAVSAGRLDAAHRAELRRVHVKGNALARRLITAVDAATSNFWCPDEQAFFASLGATGLDAALRLSLNAMAAAVQDIADFDSKVMPAIQAKGSSSRLQEGVHV